MPFPFTHQLDAMDCGPACLKMITDYHGRVVSLQKLREKSHISREGVSLAGISEAAESLGLRTMAVKVTYDSLRDQPGLTEFPLPCIVHWEQRHFVVVYKINSKYVWVADPAHGKIRLTKEQFKKSWCSDDDQGIALGLEPSPEFYKSDAVGKSSGVWSGLLPYLSPYKRLIIQFMIGILVGLVFQVMFPFLTQSLIDVGVQNQNLSFVTLILIAQLVLFVSQTFVQFIQSWIMLQIGKRVNVSLISDFLIRLMRLPLGYFDSKNVGDLIQRIQDNNRVESFLTGSVLSILFSFLSVIVFSGILLMYDVLIFGVFLLFTILYIAWVMIFMKRRADLDYLAFQQASDNQSTLFEMINGMQEIKLQGSERKRRWKWIDIQALLFRVQSKTLALRQYQDFGALFFNRLKDILITFIAARAVINGQITLGTLFAIQYIVGQLNAPFDQFIAFIRSAQDARISLTRMAEITDVTPEEDPHVQTISEIPGEAAITLDKVGFAYSPLSPQVLSDIDLTIPAGKVTAIVGASGSGKTTLLKLLLGFYPPKEGKVSVGSIPLLAINKSAWRAKCGTVMQDGYIFSDTIGNNIAESDDVISFTKLDKALHVANIQDFVYSMPLSYNTMIGAKGNGVSQGQRQRILIARAVYKDPEYLFFDEATNSLDATNERIILENLNQFFQSKTVVVVAHRLSTVKNADNIVVLDAGKIAETGTHRELVALRGKYWELVQNQLDLE
ncbi:MAG: peptidase domain-containing ABC transporter [Saprospiraceae bacterium]|nr:peptidase domain-containing ABC transporter [Saprospiraceae bacterium]